MFKGFLILTQFGKLGKFTSPIWVSKKLKYQCYCDTFAAQRSHNKQFLG